MWQGSCGRVMAGRRQDRVVRMAGWWKDIVSNDGVVSMAGELWLRKLGRVMTEFK